MRTMVLELVAVGLAVMVVSACGSMSKLKVREQNERSVGLEERLVVNEALRLDSRWLSGQWDMRSGWILALIESDSVIAFDPSDGFEVQGGRVLYRQATEGFSSQSASGELVMERLADSIAEREVKEEVHLRSAASEKVREERSVWLWSLPLFIGAVGISLLVLRKFKWSLK